MKYAVTMMLIHRNISWKWCICSIDPRFFSGCRKNRSILLLSSISHLMDGTNRISSDATTSYRITIEILFENGNVPTVHQELKLLFLSFIAIRIWYDDICPSQHWRRPWRVNWRHQAITWTNVDLSLIGIRGTHLSPIWQEVLNISIRNTSVKNSFKVNPLSQGPMSSHIYYLVFMQIFKPIAFLYYPFP